MNYYELMNNEKHYITLNNYLRSIYHKKVFKISLNGNFSCPNRDGTISHLGCLFCSAKGSGDFAGDIRLPINEQFNEIKNKLASKWPDGYYIAYFQANTNTYDTLNNLKKRYQQIITEKGPIDNNIKILSIATRPDCLNQEIIDYLKTLKQYVDIWIELGFQTMHQDTYRYLNRGYENDLFEDTLERLNKAKLTTIIHIINGLPGENEEMMIDTVRYLNKLPISGIKIHMLHILEGTPLASIYKTTPFHVLSLTEYVKIVTKQLEYLNLGIVIHRITGDAPKELLIEPSWTLKKFIVINEIDKYMRINNLYQGDLL